ncbi:hypothetical protein LCGC14_2387070 [marine sediment metagenome]|uniref:Uncharacterized protein n=1 Tax=marine sediment metagenome TaxID=412755 RepID=A0A0F9BZG8_9ZZZZ
MKFYTGDVKNPDVIRCRVCMTDLDRRTMVEGEPLMHFGTCPRCGTRWQYQYGRMEKCESQSHQFDVDEMSTWHLADPKHCTHHDHKARRAGEEFWSHYFYFPFHLKQNVWNPMQPQCKLCGISIREIIIEVLPRLKSGYQKASEQFEADRKKAMETGEPVIGATQKDPDA